MMAPVVAVYPLTATFTAATSPVNSDLGSVTVSENTALSTSIGTMAPITSVSELTSLASFGNDIVTIAAGPGGVFGNDVYAISRGAGDNNGEDGRPQGVNDPGVIYRVDPATGQSSVFFDLNTVISQLDPSNSTPTNPASNGLLTSSGLVNWYSITFDSEGIFSGTPAMFVSSVSRSDPSKNIIFEIAPNGTLMGVFTQMTDGLSSMNFNLNPTAILIPPVQDQSFLKGLIGGSGISSVGGTFAALYFESDAYSPGQTISASTLPTGVSETDLGTSAVAEVPIAPGSVGATLVNTGPIVGLTAANSIYSDPIYSVFTDFGTPAAGEIPGAPGYSGIQGSSGELLIGNSVTPTNTAGTNTGGNLELDNYSALLSTSRRFESIAFDQYGYFSQAIKLTAGASSTTTGTTYTIASQEPQFGGSVFVSDLAAGLYVWVTPEAPLPTTPILVPVQGPGIIGVTSLTGSGVVTPIIIDGNTTEGSNVGGQIIRVTEQGVESTFAYDFDTSGAQDYTSFVNSSLTLSFSSDGTTLYASDDDAIWQFKTTADLASSTSGTLVGLNDLRTLGVPYDGGGSAVAVVDTGVDAQTTAFRGRVANGTNLTTGGYGNSDLAPLGGSSTTGGTGGTGGSGSTSGSTQLINSVNGHGTPVAGVIAQFVPQATIVPVDIFLPFIGPVSLSSSSSTGGTGGSGGSGGSGGTGGSGSSSSLSGTANALTSTNLLYNGLQYVVSHPFVNDPIRPGKVDRIVAASFAFGTTQTFQSEVDAYKNYPQIVVALKNEYHKFLKEGIAPIAASGEFGAPLGGSSSSSSSTSGSTSGSTSLTGANNTLNPSVGDSNGMSLPAVLDEVISVTGVYSFPYDQTPNSPPTDQPTTVQGEIYQGGPLLLLGTSSSLGGTASSGSSGSTGGTTTATGYLGNAQLLTAADRVIYANRILGAANRSDATDFSAPAINVPTFRRQFIVTSSTTTTGTASTNSTNPLAFNVVGTSMSDAIVTGSYALVSSALSYWTTLATGNGYVDDAYLTTPVGVDSLIFGKHAFQNLEAWNNPSGINGILAWTAVPALDANDAESVSTPPTLPGGTTFRSYATVNVANAIAAVEGYEAIHYLTAHHDWNYIDVNHDGIITAQELQNFVDDSAADGLPEAGAMAALLGGTATYSAVEPGINNEIFSENPDDPGAEQRRFNFFDYAADGQLNGSVTINEYKMLGKILLPNPDAYAVTDRQRASANGFLLNPTAKRDFVALQHILPQYQWVSAAQVKKYRNVSPAQFGVALNQAPGTTFPLYTLFDPTDLSTSAPPATKNVVTGSKTANINGVNITVDWLSAVPTSLTSGGSASSTTSTTSTGTTSTASTTATATTTTTGGTTAASVATAAKGTSGTTGGTSSTASSSSTTPATSTGTKAQAVVDAVVAALSGTSSTSSSTSGTTALSGTSSTSSSTSGTATSSSTSSSTTSGTSSAVSNGKS
jgi:hypothetical protein